jgi:hypothetical protein
LLAIALGFHPASGRFIIFASAGQRELRSNSCAYGNRRKAWSAGSRCSIAFSAQSAAKSISEQRRK